jgi:hypothetical protein
MFTGMSTPSLPWRDRVLGVAAAAEAATGLALLLFPMTVVRLLLGARGAGLTEAVSRVVGAALIALGVACWPGRDPGAGADRALRGMLVYSALVTVYFLYLGVRREWVGPLLWPAAVVHAALTLLLAAAWLGGRAGAELSAGAPARTRGSRSSA